MSQYFNDSPIEKAIDDRYGFAPFASLIAKSLLTIANPIGTTIALNGPWGSGKSSVVNLIRNALPPENESNLVVTEFKCWWFKGEEALALAFLQNLNTVLRDTLGKKVENLIPHLARGLLRAGPVVGQAISAASGHIWLNPLIGTGSKFLASLFPEDATVEKTFQKLSAILEEENRRFLVIIDDIDRLNPDEALAIFRLVKSVGRLPNVLYLLVFDRELADKAVLQRYPSEGPHFLEKIVQASFEIPQPSPTDLNTAVLSSVQKICGSPAEDEVTRIMNLYFDVVAPLMTTPRHVVRFENAISVTWPAIQNEVSLADFLALEALRLYEPALFRTIRESKQVLCGHGEREQRLPNDDKRFDSFLQGVSEEHRSLARRALQRLFPRMEQSIYGSEWVPQWDHERRVCVEKHFETYFKLSLGEGRLSHAQIESLIARADDKEFVQNSLRHAAILERRNGQSMVPEYLAALTTHASDVPRGKVGALVAALFQIHDEIDLERDEDSSFGGASASLRYYWLIRALTRDRFTLEERSAMYVAALENATMGWQVDYAMSSYADYHPREGRLVDPGNCLVLEEAVPALRKRALEELRAAAADGRLLRRRMLGLTLHEWEELAGNDASEPRAWTDAQLGNNAAVVLLAKAFTGQYWSQSLGMFSLGDRVARPSTRVTIKPDTDIVDFSAFRRRLEQLDQEALLPPESLTIIRVFLAAINKSPRDP